MINLSEAKSRLRKAGDKNVRVIPMPGHSFNGDHQIEVYENSQWIPVILGLAKTVAESIVREATNRTICG